MWNKRPDPNQTPPTEATISHQPFLCLTGRHSQMEGLIPLIYKAIKDRRSAAAASTGGELLPLAAPMVNLEDPEQRRRWLQQEVRSPVHVAAVAASASAGEQQQAHRRNRSLEELAGEVGLSSDRRMRVPLPKARSIRAFSCIAGAAAV